MKEYSAKQIKELKANPYMFRVTKNKLYFTIKFKEDFWLRYQTGDAPRKILTDLGYDIKIFGQKQIDSIVQRIKQQALSGTGFSAGENRTKRVKMKEIMAEKADDETLKYMKHELLYLRQEVEFLKKIIQVTNSKERN